MFTWLLLILALLALLAGGLLLLWMRRAQMRTGLPAGQVVYSDTGVERAVTKPLVSHRLGLIGKPDYLVEVQDRICSATTRTNNRLAQPATPTVCVYVWNIYANYYLYSQKLYLTKAKLYEIIPLFQ